MGRREAEAQPGELEEAKKKRSRGSRASPTCFFPVPGGLPLRGFSSLRGLPGRRFAGICVKGGTITQAQRLLRPPHIHSLQTTGCNAAKIHAPPCQQRRPRPRPPSRTPAGQGSDSSELNEKWAGMRAGRCASLYSPSWPWPGDLRASSSAAPAHVEEANTFWAELHGQKHRLPRCNTLQNQRVIPPHPPQTVPPRRRCPRPRTPSPKTAAAAQRLRRTLRKDNAADAPARQPARIEKSRTVHRLGLGLPRALLRGLLQSIKERSAHAVKFLQLLSPSEQEPSNKY